MFPGRIAFALSVDRAVDAPLCADRMRALDGHHGKKIDLVSGLSDLHRRRQSSEPASNYCDLESFDHNPFKILRQTSVCRSLRQERTIGIQTTKVCRTSKSM